MYVVFMKDSVMDIDITILCSVVVLSFHIKIIAPIKHRVISCRLTVQVLGHDYLIAFVF
jgi:hypothetical protein